MADGSRPGWVQVAPGVEVPVDPPAFLLGDLPAEMTYAFFDETRTGSIGCYCLRDVGIMNDGVVLAKDAALFSVSLNHPAYHVERLAREMLASPVARPVRHIPGRMVMLSGPGSHIYGHWLIDILPRLFVLHLCGYEVELLRYSVSKALPPYCYEFLQLLGIGTEQLVLHDEQAEILAVDELLLPTNLRLGSRLHALLEPAVHFLRDRVAPSLRRRRAPGDRRLFLSRQGTDTSRTVENREEIEAIAAAADFEIVRPETLNIADQVAMFADAGQIVGEYGSGLHNSIFAPTGTVVAGLRGTSHHPGFIQSGIGQVLRQPTGYVLSNTPILAVDQSFSVSGDAFRLALRLADLLHRARS